MKQVSNKKCSDCFLKYYVPMYSIKIRKGRPLTFALNAMFVRKIKPKWCIHHSHHDTCFQKINK